MQVRSTGTVVTRTGLSLGAALVAAAIGCANESSGAGAPALSSSPPVVPASMTTPGLSDPASAGAAAPAPAVPPSTTAIQPPAAPSTTPDNEFGSAPAPAAQPAGGAPAGGGSAAAGDSPWCRAKEVLQSGCQTCHGAELVGGAPMPLVTYEDTQAPAISDPNKKVYELIGTRIHDTARPMPPLSQTPLEQAAITAIDEWVAGGALQGAAACAEAAPPPGMVDKEPDWPADCEEWFEIRANDNGQPHIVPADTEQELDFTIPVPWAGTTNGPVQAVAIRPIANNKRVVHHWILYAGQFDFITSWSPGKPVEVFPDGVGVHMPTSGNFRLDMHYYNVGNPNDEPDDSGLEVCITRTPRPNTATTYLFAGNATVPAGQRVSNVSTCDVTASQPVHLITSSPHMHSFGVHAKLEIIRPGGMVEVVEDAPFNWEDQHVTPIDTLLNTGDQVRITCEYNNTTSRTVTFGLSSSDEMCFNFARYYPMDALSCGGGALGSLLGGGAGGLGGFGGGGFGGLGGGGLPFP